MALQREHIGVKLCVSKHSVKNSSFKTI